MADLFLSDAGKEFEEQKIIDMIAHTHKSRDKFLMYPRFLQIVLDSIKINLKTTGEKLVLSFSRLYLISAVKDLTPAFL
ncbi:hypothetical protein QVD17_41235 [Tagetes erecta]|uniref:Uncharacterized protein n=1 Tax=Tagetes erecta TaxID=13708 RepID=A0AAD8JSY9_TARER|nr:hypothetical protein QVD17_41235 [Tagetes erecta]